MLVVFEGDGLRGGPVVNSGDFRFCEALLGSPALQRVALAVDGKRCQQLTLDVSWEHIDRLPSKATSAELLLEELSRSSDRCFVRYCLGNEKMLRAIAWRHRGEKLWFTDAHRYNEFSVAEPSLASQAVLLKPHHDVSGCRFVRIREWSDRLADVRLGHHGGLEICMSTFLFARARMPFAVHYGEVGQVLRIPYSMHSSREELEALISYIKPARVVPLCAPIVGGPSSLAT